MAAESTRKNAKTPMTPASLEGQTLGRYRILEPLGRGGMAQVYKAYHPGLDRYVAVKVLRSDLVEEQEFLARFRREARAVASLRHPNVVQVYDFDVHDDSYYMVMELLEGDTLKTHLNACRIRRQKLLPGEVARILQDALAGLAYAHSEGIIHRDLKPANIMLTRRGQAVLTDFGIAQIVGGTQYTVSGALMGTLNYMAPEQGMDGRCDARSDLYSLGIVFFEMLTGSVPYDADTPLAILMKHMNDPLPMPHRFDPRIPEAFERIVLKALAKNPDDRYQSAAEMAEALNQACQEAGILVPGSVELPRPQPQAGGVAVFSGAARQQIPDAGFARGDTDITTGRRSRKITEKIMDAVDPRTIKRAVLGGVGVFLGVNMLLLWASGIFGWGVLGHSWPMELVAIGILLVAIMITIRSPWMLIPVGLLLGNGFIMAYFTLSGRWSDWTIFWPCEPFLVAGSIIAPFWFVKRGEQGLKLLRSFGILLLFASVAVFGITLVVAVIQALVF